MMHEQTMILVGGAVAFSTAGQLLLKSGARGLTTLGRVEFLVAAAQNPYVLSGLAAWIASTLCWRYVLRSAPLSRVYGFTSLTFVLVTLASAYLFGEPLRRLQGLGTVLIVIGVACLLSGK